MPNLPTETGPSKMATKRSKAAGKAAKQDRMSNIAHDIEAKARTEDVLLSGESRDKDFSALMLSDRVLEGLRKSGFVKPSPIQLAAIPNGKIGLDMIVQSKSGTGKTCVYVVIALEMIKSELPGLQALILAPTREIAMQGLEVATQIGSQLPDLKIASFIGGLPVAEDRIKAARCHMAIGTPGRMKQLLDEKILNADTVRLAILDEADKLLEPNFVKETTHILNLLPQSKQFIALSATYPDELCRVAEKFMRSPQHIRLGKENQVLHGIRQFALMVEHSPVQAKQNQLKQLALLKILSSVSYNQCLIFSNYQIIAQSTSDFLNSRGFPSICISAGQDQIRRLQTMKTFKAMKCRILCSTDLTARGIDAENVNLVINLDTSEDHNTYLHRIGRGGRYGSKSTAISLAADGKEWKRLRKIVSLSKSDIRVLPADLTAKDVSGGDLPLLEGATEKELEEDRAKKAVRETEKSETDKSVKEGTCEDNAKTGGKKKIRGKKRSKTNSEVVADKSKQIKAGISSDAEFKDKILGMIFKDAPFPEVLGNINDFSEVDTIASAMISNTLMDSRMENVVDMSAVESLGKYLSHNISSLENEHEKLLEKAALLVGHRADVFDLVKTQSGRDLLEPAAMQRSEQEIAPSAESTDVPKSFTSSEDSSDSSSDTSSEISDEEEDEPNVYIDTGSGELPADPLDPAQLQLWIQQVDRQRQLIQSREYWSIRQAYASSGV